MKNTFTLLCAAFMLTAAHTLAQDNEAKPPATLAPPAQFGISTNTAGPNSTTTATTPNTTTTATTPNTTTTATTPNTTTTATTPNTTTTATTPNTTTTATTTTATTPNTTTTATTPNTTTTATTPNTTTTATTTTSPPGPTPGTNLTLGNYTIKDKSNNLCIMVQAAMQVYINNSHADGKFIVQPKDVATAGSCQDKTAEIQMKFNEGHITLIFIKNDTTNSVYVNSVNVSLAYAFKSGALYYFSKENKSLVLFSTAPGDSYSCKSESVYLGDGISLEFSKERLQAFGITNGQFGPVDLCKADQPDYSVAIAVGVVLLILILIVVIAYFISRKKRTDGYQTL